MGLFRSKGPPLIFAPLTLVPSAKASLSRAAFEPGPHKSLRVLRSWYPYLVSIVRIRRLGQGRRNQSEENTREHVPTKRPTRTQCHAVDCVFSLLKVTEKRMRTEKSSIYTGSPFAKYYNCNRIASNCHMCHYCEMLVRAMQLQVCVLLTRLDG